MPLLSRHRFISTSAAAPRLALLTLIGACLPSVALAQAPIFEISELKLPEVRSIAPSVGNADRFIDLFRPAQTDLATLSPDGRYLAFSLREGDQLSVIITETDHLDVALTKVAVVDDKIATPRFGRHDENVPAAINWMKWVGDNQLVIETNGQVATGAQSSIPGIILTTRADGKDARVLLTGRDVPELVQEVDEPLPLLRRGVGEEAANLLRRWQPADRVEKGPTKKCRIVARGRGGQVQPLELLEDEFVDQVGPGRRREGLGGNRIGEGRSHPADSNL